MIATNAKGDGNQLECIINHGETKPEPANGTPAYHSVPSQHCWDAKSMVDDHGLHYRECLPPPTPLPLPWQAHTPGTKTKHTCTFTYIYMI